MPQVAPCQRHQAPARPAAETAAPGAAAPSVPASAPRATPDDALGPRLARSVELRARCDKQALQRLVGFGVELSVPTFGDGTGPGLQGSLQGKAEKGRV